MTPNLQRLFAEATARPWATRQYNWRGEPVPYDWYIHGNIHEAADPESDDPEENTGSSTSVAIVVGNATAGRIPEASARLIALAVNHFEELVRALSNARRSILCPSDDRAANASAVESGYLLAKIEAAAKETP